ncbi:MAG: signal peptide peptidase SppA [Acidobacteria bacterium]|nr:signal peptide peptidase SppA [Acidobacteriota bacterium]
MAKARSWFLGGCLAVVLGMVFMFFVGRYFMTQRVPEDAILSIRLQGSLPEVSTHDVLSQMLGESQLSLRDVRRALVHATGDTRIKGVRVRIDSFGGGFAKAQELRTLLSRVAHAGKWTAAYMDTDGEFAPGNLEYYVASSCQEVSMNPIGDVNLIGLSARTPFLRGTFDKLGIKPEFLGRGDYKTARFMYTKKKFTPAQKEMLGWLLDSYMDQLVRGVAANRHLTPQAVSGLIDRAPLLARDAVAAKLVDRLEDWSSFCARLSKRQDDRARPVGVEAYLQRVGRTDSGPRIAVVTAVGGIMRGESRKSMNPLLGSTIMGSDTIARAWRRVRETRGIRAAIFRINSPGGSAVASEIIRQEMAKTAKKIPVVVSMSNVAGSGGYWITCGAKEIVADPATLTASIGVFAGHLNSEKFWSHKLGVTFGRMDRGANADIYGGLQDWTDAQRGIVNRMLDSIYHDFVVRVATARHMTPEQVNAIGQGRVFTGEQALTRGLVDKLGGFDTALAEAKRLAGISARRKVRLVDFPRPVPMWQRLLHVRSNDEAEMRAALAEVRQALDGGTLQAPGVVWMPPIIIR